MDSAVDDCHAALFLCGCRGPDGVYARYVVAVVASTMVIGDEPGIGFGLELADGAEVTAVEAGRQHSWRMVWWKRSHTAL